MHVRTCAFAVVHRVISCCNRRLIMVTHTHKQTNLLYALEDGFSHGGALLRGLRGICVNIQTFTQTHPAARSHHVVEERGQSGNLPKA